MRSVLLAVALAVSPCVAFADDSGPIEVEVGKTVKLSAAGVRRVSVGDPEIADIEVKGGSVVVKGVAPGKTFVKITRKKSQEREVVVTAP